MKTTDITCPKCGHIQKIEIPEDKCMPFYRCEGCDRIIAAPPGECCVICSYASGECPVGRPKMERK